MGEFLKTMPKATGAMGNPGGQGASVVRCLEGTAQPATLAEIGITKIESSRAQKLADIPKKQVAEHTTTEVAYGHLGRGLDFARLVGGLLTTERIGAGCRRGGIRHSGPTHTYHLMVHRADARNLAVAQLRKLLQRDLHGAAFVGIGTAQAVSRVGPVQSRVPPLGL